MLLGRRPRVLLLTASIRPAASVDGLIVRDPQERRQEYLHAFRAAQQHVGRSVDGLVLAENSEADLSEFEQIAAADPRVEVLPVPPRDGGRGAGRGWLETHLVSDAFDRSRLLADPEVTAWKLTGRYQLLNLAKLVDAGPHGHDLVLNVRRYPSPWADMWVYATTARGIGLLHERLDRLREDLDQAPAERALYDSALELRDEGHDVALRLAAEPYLTGRRGWDGTPYDSSTQRSKWLLRSAGKRLAPGLWI